MTTTRNHRARAALAAIACCLCLALPVCAHDFWILPSTFAPAPAGRVDLGLRVGMGFEGEPVVRRPERIERFEAVFGDQATPIEGQAGADPAGSFIATEPGLHIVVYRSHRSRIELDASKFEDYLREEGLERIIERRRDSGHADAPAREVYSRCAKALINCATDGGPTPDATDRAVGLALELVVTTPLAEIRPGEPIQAVLLLDGQPLADSLISAVRSGAPDLAVSDRTDREGRVWLPLDEAGIWMLKCVHMDAAPPDADADWESLWATVTFELAPSAR